VLKGSVDRLNVKELELARKDEMVMEERGEIDVDVIVIVAMFVCNPEYSHVN
jgi:hypothetical protein